DLRPHDGRPECRNALIVVENDRGKVLRDQTQHLQHLAVPLGAIQRRVELLVEAIELGARPAHVILAAPAVGRAADLTGRIAGQGATGYWTTWRSSSAK